MKNITFLCFIFMGMSLYSSVHHKGSDTIINTKTKYNYQLQNDTALTANYMLIWADEFNNNTLNTKNWNFETGMGGWGNNEWQNYTNDSNCIVSGGTLKIVAKLEGEGQKVGDYTSARLNSKKLFTYGKFEVRAKIPANKGNGLWPAIWMLGDTINNIGWPNCGELDIMEYVSYAPDTVYFTIHSSENNHRKGTQISSGGIKFSNLDENFHTYGLIWTDTYLEFYMDKEDNIKLRVDRPEKYNQNNWPFHNPFYIILNMAVGGDWGGSHGVKDMIFPATMEIDYVRVYKKSTK